MGGPVLAGASYPAAFFLTLDHYLQEVSWVGLGQREVAVSGDLGAGEVVAFVSLQDDMAVWKFWCLRGSH